MKTYSLEREIYIPSNIDEVWDFFSSPKNLQRITPPEMKFKILSNNLPECISDKLLIEYSVVPLLSIKVNWTTVIHNVDKPFFFVDEQLKGPYRKWIHKHSFHKTDNGTIMKDEVEYAIPFEPIGSLLLKKTIQKKLKHIFDYRTQAIKNIFKKK